MRIAAVERTRLLPCCSHGPLPKLVTNTAAGAGAFALGAAVAWYETVASLGELPWGARCWASCAWRST